jgi:uncharacterized protein
VIQQSTIGNSASESPPLSTILDGGANALESKDGKSRIKQASSRVESGAREKEMAASGGKLDEDTGGITRPVLIVGFPGTGLVGSICANYIIEKKSLHQIAFVDSEYIIPAAIYIGGKLRHPFRIYADGKRALCVIVCEAPLRPEGVYSIMELVVTWALRNEVREVLVLDGVPVRGGGLPSKDRKPMILSSSSSPSSFSNASKDDPIRNAMMMGVSGGLISACLSDEMPCTGVLIPSISGIPDPEGAAILLETISKMPSVPLEIDVKPLRQEGQAIERQLKEFMNSVRKEQQEEEGRGRYLRSSRIYG